MVRKTALVLTGNGETESLVRRIGGNAAIFCDTGVRKEFLLDRAPIRRRLPGLRMLWTGRMLYRKAMPIIFQAMKRAGREDFSLDLVGTGPMEPSWRNAVRKLDLEKQVKFHGQVSFTEVFAFYDRADLFVFPSVNDSLGSQLLEAACRGLPILTLNHQGGGTLLPKSAAWKVSVDSVERTINEMAEAMVTLSDSAERLSAMSIAAINYAHTESWPKRVVRMSELYEELLATSSAKSPLSGEGCLS